MDIDEDDTFIADAPQESPVDDLFGCLCLQDAPLTSTAQDERLVVYEPKHIVKVDEVDLTEEVIDFNDLPKPRPQPKKKKAKGQGYAEFLRLAKNQKARMNYHSKMLRHKELMLSGVRHALTKATSAGERKELKAVKKTLKKKIANSMHVLTHEKAVRQTK